MELSEVSMRNRSNVSILKTLWKIMLNALTVQFNCNKPKVPTTSFVKHWDKRHETPQRLWIILPTYMVTMTISLFYRVHKHGGRDVICIFYISDGLTRLSVKSWVQIFKLRISFKHSSTRPASPQASQNLRWRSVKFKMATDIEYITSKAHLTSEFAWKN